MERAECKRIKLNIQMPSVALRRFIEKSLKDDDFLDSAIENPIGVLKESGVNLDVSAFAPRDFATFFGALAGVKELVKKKEISDVSFQKIFGEAADLRGSILSKETHRGMWTQFDKDAQAEKEMFKSVNIDFERTRDAFKQLSNLAVREAQLRLDLDMAGKTETSQGTDTGYSFHFDNVKGMFSSTEKSIDSQTSKNFSGLGLSQIDEVMNGPLISPEELSAISAVMKTLVNIGEQTEVF